MRVDRILELPRERLLDRVRALGVVETTTGIPADLAFAGDTHTLVVNAVEREPAYYATTLLLEKESRRIADTLRLLKDALDLRRVVLSTSPWAGDELPTFLPAARKAGIEVQAVEDAREVLRRHVPVDHPIAESGFAFLSAETIRNLGAALRDDAPVLTKLIQVLGDVERAYVFDVPIGAFARDLRDVANTTFDERLGAILVGPEGATAPGEITIAGGVAHVGKTTTTLLVVSEEHLAGPPRYALEAIAPVDAIVDLTPDVHRVRVPLASAVGASPVPIVREGDRVRRGDLVASAEGETVASPAHAPIGGRIEAVTADAIEITAERAWAHPHVS